MIELLLKIFGDPNEKKIKKIQPIIDYINSLEPEISNLSDEELKSKTTEFQNRLLNRSSSSNPERDKQLEQEA